MRLHSLEGRRDAVAQTQRIGLCGAEIRQHAAADHAEHAKHWLPIRPSTISPMSAFENVSGLVCRGGSRSEVSEAVPRELVGESESQIGSIASTTVGLPSTRASREGAGCSWPSDRSVRRRDTTAREISAGCRSRSRRPSSARRAWRAEQMVRARGDRERGGHGGDADYRPEQRPAYRHRGSTAARLQCHAHVSHPAWPETGSREEIDRRRRTARLTVAGCVPRGPQGGHNAASSKSAALPRALSHDREYQERGPDLVQPAAPRRSEPAVRAPRRTREAITPATSSDWVYHAARLSANSWRARHPERAQQRMLARLQRGLARQRLTGEQQRRRYRRAARGPTAPAPGDGSSSGASL